MKKLVLNLAVILFTASNVFSQTSVPGGIVNGTWTLAGSPYNVSGSIQIVNGDSLRIEPGVKVVFQGTYKLLVLGKLMAEGTAYNMITFTAADTTSGWRGIRFDGTAATNDTSRITYCIIEYGRASGSVTPEKNGGGIYIGFSKVVVSYSHIEHCSAERYGGGIYLITSSAIIKNNSITKNTLNETGGDAGVGICVYSGSPRIINNTISFNFSKNSDGVGIHIQRDKAFISNNTITYNRGGSGGGINIFDGSPTISNNIISNNTVVSGSGGGINVSNSNGTPSISNNIISNNIAQNTAGGINCHGSATITNNTIINNIAASGGGGIECYTKEKVTISYNFISNNTVSPTTWHYLGGGGIWCVNGSTDMLISNNVIVNNTATNGGGILCYNASPIFTNNTIANNKATNNGGALSCSGGSPVFINCILWGNTAVTSGSQAFLYDEPSDPVFNYCDVQGGSATFEVNGNFYTGTYTYCINKNPLFLNPSGGSGVSFDGLAANWSLQYTSPCKNAGNPAGTYPATDIAGNTRVMNGIIDIGAYELGGLKTDAGISALSPSDASYCGSSKKPIIVQLTNYGIDTLKTADITWKLNGTVKKTVSWSGMLSPFKSATVTIDSLLFVQGNTYDIMAYSSKPNSVTDLYNTNDTAKTRINVYANPDATFAFAVAKDTVNFTRNNTSSATSLWDFGDGNSSTQKNPSHIYTHARTYTVTHTITSVNGCVASYQDSFNVMVAGIKLLSKSAKLSVYPNPVNSATTVQYTLAKPSAVNITIYDLSGKNIYTSDLGLLSSGKHSSQLDVSGFSAGIYLLKIDAGNVSMYSRIVKE